MSNVYTPFALGVMGLLTLTIYASMMTIFR